MKLRKFLTTCAGCLVASALSVSAAESGIASHYSVKSNGGTITASGEKLCDKAMTAAHKTLPMGTIVRVTNLKNNKSVIVKLNDRGPYIKGRIIDVSQAAAHALGFHKQGIARVKVEVVQKANKKSKK